MADQKYVKLTFIDDGDDLTDSAVLAGLMKAKQITKAGKLPSVTKRISPPSTLKASDIKKS